MNYYHCHIVISELKKDKEYILNDLDKQNLLDTIVQPYASKEQFVFDGYVINPAQVKRLKVTETDKPASYYADRHNAEMRNAGIADFATDRRKIPIDEGKDITVEILSSAKPLTTSQKENSNHKETKITNSKKVFIVHGHDMATLHELCRILKDEFGLEPVVLNEQPSIGLDTIITKFERLASDCFCAIVLLTPDDKIENAENSRARQNVIFELGYFLGMLRVPDKRKIIILKKGQVEIPSDIAGVLYCQFQNSVTEVFYQIKKQFEIWE